MRRSLVLAAVILTAVFAVYARVPAAETASPASQASSPAQSGVTSPREPSVRTIVQPAYTAAAMQAGIEGDVGLEAVVTPAGDIRDVRIVRSLDREHGLDDQAVAAVRQWRFDSYNRPEPATFYIELQFRQLGAGRRGAAPDDFETGAMLEGTPRLVKPTVVRTPSPAYTSDAMRSRIQGAVEVQAVVNTLGEVSRARVVRTAWATERGPDSLRSTAGLIESALTAARNWTFKPASLDGVPVPVVVTIVLNFRIH